MSGENEVEAPRLTEMLLARERAVDDRFAKLERRVRELEEKIARLEGTRPTTRAR